MSIVDNENVHAVFKDYAVIATVKSPKITDLERGAILSDIQSAAKLHGFRLVVDMKHVLLVGSSGLGMLITLNKDARAAGGKFAVCNVNAEVLSMLKVSNLLKILPVHKDVDAALAFVK